MQRKHLSKIIIPLVIILALGTYTSIHTLRNMTYAKAEVSESQLSGYLDGAEAFVSLGDMYNKKSPLSHTIIMKNGERLNQGVLLINKNDVYKVEAFNTTRIELGEYLKMWFNNL